MFVAGSGLSQEGLRSPGHFTITRPLAVSPFADVLQTGCDVEVLALAVAQVVAPRADVVIAVRVEILAVTFALVVRPLT